LSQDSSQGRVVQLSLDADSVQIVGVTLLQDRRATLFFRSILGAEVTEQGWRCRARRSPLHALILQVHDWLRQRGYTVERVGQVEEAVARELERRASFFRTRDAAARLREGDQPAIKFGEIDKALSSFDWSSSRQLRPHQKDAAAHALTAINAANFSVPGAGKTAATLAVALTHLHARTIDLVVVVGPLACFAPWENETKACVGARLRVRRVRGSAKQRRDAYGKLHLPEILLLSYATAAADLPILQELFSSQRVMLIVDESHRVKRFRGGVWAPALLELARRARVRVILSGTPMPQSAKDLYNQLNILWPDAQLTGSRDAFSARIDSDFPGVIRSVVPFVSRTPKSALGLPPPHVTRHEVPLAGTQAEIYDLIETRFQRSIQDAETWRDKLEALRRCRPIRLLQAATNPDLFNVSDTYYSVPPLEDRNPTLMERLAAFRQNEYPEKSSAALDIINSISQKGGKVVCWSNFVPNLDHFTNLVRKTLNLPCFQIDGRVPAGLDALHSDGASDEGEAPGDYDTREAIIEAFLDSPGPAVLVTNPASCSESISLHRTCHNAIYIDRTYDCALYLQSIDRIHRLGLPADAEVHIHLLLATIYGRPTIDHLVDSALEAKSVRMAQLLEGAEIAPIHMSQKALVDAEGSDEDLAELLRYLLGEGA
jgi:SNF2 family DNA or RNA helicase